MTVPRARKKLTLRTSLSAIAISVAILVILGTVIRFFIPHPAADRTPRFVSTLAGIKGEMGEPFGIAMKGNEIFVSDGQHGNIWRIDDNDPRVFADGLHTPSAIAFGTDGRLLVVDTGTHTIRAITEDGSVATLAGVDGRAGSADGEAGVAQFRGPIGLAIRDDGRIFVSDTYNDRIRVIENGRVATYAGSDRGYADGLAAEAKFDTPTSLALWRGRLIVADTGNRRIRVIEDDGRVWTLAGNGDEALTDGPLLSASFVQPSGLAVDAVGSIFVSDGNALRLIGGTLPSVVTISDHRRGLADGPRAASRFSRPSGLAIGDNDEVLIADSENRLVRKLSPTAGGHLITPEQVRELRDKPETFRDSAPARWPFDPPHARRDIAGTLGEVRGEVNGENDQVWFHNGLDIAGAYGETARFIRDEKVLRPIAAENFGTLRELLRMPTLGYVHIRLGRDPASLPFGDERFLFHKDAFAKIVDVRVPRGTAFKAGDAIGTLNSMNHVHLVAGRSGSEMNAIDALVLPGVSDTRPPVIEKVSLFSENWEPIETSSVGARIKLTGKTRVVVRAFDQVDGNAERRRLGLYKLGYQLLRDNMTALADTRWSIVFDRMPSNEAVPIVYARGSHSGATGETIFNYIVTNRSVDDDFGEGFLEGGALDDGSYVLRVFAGDYFGNITSRDIQIEVKK